MNTIKLSAICVCVFAVSLLTAQTTNSSFYNPNGTFAGNAITNGNSTSFYNANNTSDGSSTTGGSQNNNNQNKNKSFRW